MTDVTVWILHAAPARSAGPLERGVAEARAAIAERHRRGFADAGATSVRVVAGPPDDTPFGARLRELVAVERPGGVVVLGAGSVPLATVRDRLAFVEAARGPGLTALANNRFSADVVGVSCAERLLDVPNLPSDNALPRWLEEVAGYAVSDLRRRWRLAIDVDGPLDLLLIGGDAGPDGAVAAGRLAAVARTAGDRRAELLVAGRTSAATLAFLERAAAARVRALVEERGMRAASRLAQEPEAVGRGSAARPTRAPSSVLGLLLDRDGPASLGPHLARLADAAVLDTRVLLAHRLGPDPASWPSAEDRFASDLLLAERVVDPWLRELTASAAAAPIPVVLGAHTLVGPGLRLLLGRARWS